MPDSDTQAKSRWRRIQTLFDAAVDVDPAERVAWLEQQCADDGDLLTEVRALLECDERTSRFLQPPMTPAGDETQPLDDDDHDPQLGRRVGAYELTRVIATGGMGTVYLAARADQHFDKQVAVKLIRPGMDTADIVRRFRNERQVLAGLEHPNIARLIDGGVTEHDGRPYLVMEYVEGTPLDCYCDDHRLSITDRLELFGAVCDAVQHAHHNLIVHRDLKPRNILVTADGIVKLLDFGIAKVLDVQTATDADDATTIAGRLMTPRYASPEQILGERITTASDVYSLGVILYELLTGHRPYQLDTDSRAAIEWAARDDEPTRPSASVSRTETLPRTDGDTDTRITPEAVSAARRTNLRQLKRDLRGDLDTIVLMALRKEPPRRYASVEQFGDDIARYMSGKPVAARPNTLRYVTGKFIRRNKALVSAGALLISVLIGWVVTSTWLLADATEARKAESERAFEAGQAAASARLAQQDAERKGENAEWQSYIANIAAADAALQAHRPGMARSRLNMAPEHLRNWEWRHLYQRLDRSRMVLQHPPDQFDKVTITADGLTAVGSGRNRITFWDLSSGEVVRTIPAQGVRQFSLSPDSTRIAWATRGRKRRSVHVVDIEGDVTLRELSGHHSEVYSVTYSPDGRFIAAGTRNGLTMLWDAESGEILHGLLSRDGTSDRGASLAFTPDSRHLAVGGWMNNIRVWNCASGELISKLSGHNGSVLGVAFGPDGSRLASGSSDRTVRIWDPMVGEQLLRMYGHEGRVECVAFGPRGDRIVSGGMDQTLRLWNADTGAPLDVLQGHTATIWAAAWSPDGGAIASASTDGTVRIWDVDPEGIRGAGHWIYSLDVSPDNRLVATGSMYSLVIHDLPTRQLVAKLDPPRNEKGQGHAFCVDFSPDGRRFAAGGIGSAIRIWEVDTWQEIATFTGHERWIRTVEISPDGQRLVSGGDDRTARVWNVSTGESIVLEGHESAVTCARFSPDGALIVTGSLDRSVRFWDAETGEHLDTLDDFEAVDPRGGPTGVQDLAFSPDGSYLATGSLDALVIIWDVATKKRLATLDGRSDTYGVAFSPDGSRIVSGHDDQTIKLWDVEVAIHRPWLPAQVATFRQHTDRVNDITFSPNGQLMVSVGRDSWVRLWRTKPPARPDFEPSPPKRPFAAGAAGSENE